MPLDFLDPQAVPSGICSTLALLSAAKLLKAPPQYLLPPVRSALSPSAPRSPFPFQYCAPRSAALGGSPSRSAVLRSADFGSQLPQCVLRITLGEDCQPWSEVVAKLRNFQVGPYQLRVGVTPKPQKGKQLAGTRVNCGELFFSQPKNARASLRIFCLIFIEWRIHVSLMFPKGIARRRCN